MNLKRILYIISFTLSILIGLFLFAKWGISNWFVSQETPDKIPAIMEMSFAEEYVSDYDNGVITYKEEKYPEAEQLFEKASKNMPDNEYDCQNRINWALSICYQIDFENLQSKEDTEMALQQLQRASDILCQHGCAVYGRQGEWHNDAAQQLEDDIEKMIQQLEQQLSSSGQDENEQQQQPESEEEKHEREQKRQELMDNRRDTMEASKREQSQSMSFGDMPGLGNGKTW